MNWEKRTVRTFFFIGGFGSASWAPLVPFLKQRLAVGEDVLGMLLLCIGAGSLVTMPLCGELVRRFGCKRSLVVFGISYALILACLAAIDSFWLCVGALFAFGAVMGIVDVVNNIAAVNLEKTAGEQLMSGLHGMWSVGGFVGAGIFGLWLQLGWTPFMAVGFASTLMIVLALFFSRVPFREVKNTGKSSGIFAIPRGIVMVIGIITLIAFLVEGAIMDWSGVFLTSVRSFDMSYAGLGFSIYSAAMLMMRLSGDAIVKRFGGFKVVMVGGVVSLVGFVMMMFSESPVFIFGGFFLIGIGVANIVPTFYSLTGRQKVMPLNMAVSAISTLGYLGILAGPAVIGIIAHQTSLIISFCFLAALMVILLGLAVYVFKNIEK